MKMTDVITTATAGAICLAIAATAVVAHADPYHQGYHPTYQQPQQYQQPYVQPYHHRHHHHRHQPMVRIHIR
jgi:hypothetical protein